MGAKIFLGLFAASSVLTLTTVGAGAAVFYSAGTFSVETHARDGSNVSVSLPAIAAHLAIAVAPDELLADLRHELEPVWPTVEAAVRELHRAPDFVLLEVRSADERIVIAKRDGQMVIEIDSGGDQVRVKVPIGTLKRFVDKLEDRRDGHHIALVCPSSGESRCSDAETRRLAAGHDARRGFARRGGDPSLLAGAGGTDERLARDARRS